MTIERKSRVGEKAQTSEIAMDRETEQNRQQQRQATSWRLPRTNERTYETRGARPKRAFPPGWQTENGTTKPILRRYFITEMINPW
jgi:hypothetical protein